MLQGDQVFMEQHLLSEHSHLLIQLVLNTWEAMLWANTQLEFLVMSPDGGQPRALRPLQGQGQPADLNMNKLSGLLGAHSSSRPVL